MSLWSSWPSGITLIADPKFGFAFPKLGPRNCTGEFSPATRKYNCFAWAASDDKHRWEPDPFFQYYWPKAAPRQYTIDAFVRAYQTIGYSVTANGQAEDGFEKIAIYARGGVPTHAARQLENGHWTTKFGHLEDVEHLNVQCLEGPEYGEVVVFMKRVRTVTS